MHLLDDTHNSGEFNKLRHVGEKEIALQTFAIVTRLQLLLKKVMLPEHQWRNSRIAETDKWNFEDFHGPAVRYSQINVFLPEICDSKTSPFYGFQALSPLYSDSRTCSRKSTLYLYLNLGGGVKLAEVDRSSIHLKFLENCKCDFLPEKKSGDLIKKSF